MGVGVCKEMYMLLHHFRDYLLIMVKLCNSMMKYYPLGSKRLAQNLKPVEVCIFCWSASQWPCGFTRP